jgi:DNA-binding CsgD family transcriptional regulator
MNTTLNMLNTPDSFPSQGTLSQAQARVSQASLSQARLSQTQASQTKLSQTKLSQVNPSQSNPSQVNPSQVNPSQSNSSQSNLSQCNPSQAQASQSRLQSSQQPRPFAQSASELQSHPASLPQTSKFSYLADAEISFVSQLSHRVANQTSTNSPLSDFLRGIMECLFDGTMLVSLSGELIYANSDARQICHALGAKASEVPAEIWKSCEALSVSLELYPDRPVIVEDELRFNDVTVRLRVRQFEVEVNQALRSCFLVTLEDQAKSAQYRAMAEARKYGLTGRETNVWELKRAGYTYKEIAAELFISEDTVKKHVKNIHVKRNAIDF